MKALTTLLGFLTLSSSLTSAAIVYSGVQDIVIPTTFDGIYLDLDTGSTSASVIGGWDINPIFAGVGIGGSPSFQPARVGTGNMDTILRFNLHDLIDDGLFYSAGETGSSDHLGASGNFQDGISGYLGFKFSKNDSSGPFYGWMRLTLTANTPGAFIHDWAWESSGAAILAGMLAVPEPGRAWLLFAGILTIICHRKRQ